MPVPVFTTPDQILNPAVMKARRDAYFAFTRRELPAWFTPDGHYLPDTEKDYRITFWAFPALIATSDPVERQFALDLLQHTPGWTNWNIFVTSSIIGILARERHALTPELIAMAENHARTYVMINGSRGASSAANDYMFHGYNDNMPAMATRALILAGEQVDHAELRDRGRFLLEGLCAQFTRCGLLAEYNSGTYTPITMAALADVAELSQDAETREMAAACVNRVMLELLAHWHYGVGTTCGSSSRAYVTDRVQTLSNANGMGWYLGLPGALDPGATLGSYMAGDGGYTVPLHHGPAACFNIAQICEFMVADYLGCLRPETLAFARRAQTYPQQLLASSEGGRAASVQTRVWKQPDWSLGSVDRTMWARQCGQHVCGFATWRRRQPLRDYRDRGHFTAWLQDDDPDVYDPIKADYGSAPAANSSITDKATWRTVQQRGSLMAVGQPGTVTIDKSYTALRLVLAACTWDHAPDEMWVGDKRLTSWNGESPDGAWHFLCLGDVYLGMRAVAMRQGQRCPARRTTHSGMLRLELAITDPAAAPTTLDAKAREWTDLAYVVELADAAECGDFASFRAHCLATRWEAGRCFYRNSRYLARHGELQIIDTIEPDDVKVVAIDGETEPHVHFSMTGLPAIATRLFPDGHRVVQRKLWYDHSFIGSPFYGNPSHSLVTD